MSMPEELNWNSRLCVSEQGDGRRTVTWNIGVSPMKFNDLIMVNQKSTQETPVYAYTTYPGKSCVISSQIFENKAERE